MMNVHIVNQNDLSQVDVKGLAKINQGQQHRQLKRRLMKAGFEHQLSLYGVVKDTRTGQYRYVRIEILSRGPYDLFTLPRVYEYFHRFKPFHEYTIWTYDAETDTLKEQGAWL